MDLRWVRGDEFSILGEVEYIRQRAAEADGKMVTVGGLILFCTSTGDAWMLDAAEGLAVPVAEDGIPVEVHIEETLERFTVAWSHSYSIDGDRMTFEDKRSGERKTAIGYPARQIQQVSRDLPPTDR